MSASFGKGRISIREVAKEISFFYPEVRTLDDLVVIMNRVEKHFTGRKEIKANEWQRQTRKAQKSLKTW